VWKGDIFQLCRFDGFLELPFEIPIGLSFDLLSEDVGGIKASRNGSENLNRSFVQWDGGIFAVLLVEDFQKFLAKVV